MVTKTKKVSALQYFGNEHNGFYSTIRQQQEATLGFFVFRYSDFGFFNS